MTKKEMFAMIATVNADNAEIVEFCNHEIELLSNRKTSKGRSKNQKANDALLEVIAEVLARFEDGATVTELLNTEELNEYTNQKISALLRLMKDAGTVEKEIRNRKAYFSLA